MRREIARWLQRASGVNFVFVLDVRLDQRNRIALRNATFEEAMARFRLMPPQPCENLYILDYIARRSLKRAPMADGSGEGWTWKFDATMWEKLDRSGMAYGGERPRPQVPTIHIYGGKSLIVQRRAKGEPHFLDGIPEIEIPESHHHVMLDQPLALVAALRTLLGAWPA